MLKKTPLRAYRIGNLSTGEDYGTVTAHAVHTERGLVIFDRFDEHGVLRTHRLFAPMPGFQVVLLEDPSDR